MKSIDPRLPANPKADDLYVRMLNIRLNEILRDILIRLDGLENMYADISAEIAITGKYKNRPASIFNIMGRRSSWVNTTDQHDLCEFLSTQSIPDVSGSESWEVVSSSANDTAAGTGARTIHVTYLDSAGAQQEVTGITLNGTTPVSIAGMSGATAIQWAEVASAGSGGIAAGNIDIRAATGPVVHERITAGGNRSMSARYRVPTGCNVYLLNWDCAAAGNQIDFRLRANVDMFDGSTGTVYLFQDTALTPSGTTRDAMHLEWRKIPAGAIVKVSGIPNNASTTRGDVGFHIICMEQ